MRLVDVYTVNSNTTREHKSVVCVQLAELTLGYIHSEANALSCFEVEVLSDKRQHSIPTHTGGALKCNVLVHTVAKVYLNTSVCKQRESCKIK